jgi:hypothetical protein
MGFAGGRVRRASAGLRVGPVEELDRVESRK